MNACFIKYCIDDLVQDSSNSNALAMELVQSYTKQSIFASETWLATICTVAQ